MNVGWIGLGKLGLPCALVMSRAGHKVVGTDVNTDVAGYIQDGRIPYEEVDVEESFASGFSVGWRDSVAAVVHESDVLFVAVQTPHAPQFEGCTVVGGETRDFDNGYLVQAVREVVEASDAPKLVVIVSTVLPGTFQREIEPLAVDKPNVELLYSPAFIAMGTTMLDFQNPEMVIVGGNVSDASRDTFVALHRSIHEAPIVWLQPIECELVKMSYNTYIGMKIVFANALGELCEKVGGDVDNVTEALALASHRIISPKYLRSGMGDGGGCHPRDQLALSWLAGKVGLSTDLFGYLMSARDSQTDWQARLCIETSEVANLPIRICGREYKAETKLTVGSPSRLLMSMLGERADWQDDEPHEPAVFFIGVNHERYANWDWPRGSIIIDPWGIVPDKTGVVVRRIGRRRNRDAVEVF